jgi:hypothetical protein
MTALRPLQTVLGSATKVPPSKFGKQDRGGGDYQRQEVVLAAGKAVSVNHAGDDGHARDNQYGHPDDPGIH